MKRRHLAAALLLALAAFFVSAAVWVPGSEKTWVRGTTYSVSLSGSEAATDTIAGPAIDIAGANHVLWEVWGDSVKLAAPNLGEVPTAACSVVTVQVSMTGHDTSWVAAPSTQMPVLDRLTNFDINNVPRFVYTFARDSVSSSTTAGVGIFPYRKARLLFIFYGAQIRNVRDVFVRSKIGYQ